MHHQPDMFLHFFQKKGITSVRKNRPFVTAQVIQPGHLQHALGGVKVTSVITRKMGVTEGT